MRLIASFLLACSSLLLHAEELTLYYAPYCPYSRKVTAYLEQHHKTLPMKDVSASYKAKEELIEIGGKAQVPCLVIDGKALYNSDDIIKYLSQHQDLLHDS